MYHHWRDWLSGHAGAGRLLLALAIAVGSALRFRQLGAISMTADEGAAWAAATQPVSRLIQVQPQLDSGKLALYDLLLHCWIGIFGDSLRSMRGLSAAIDTSAILLIFAVVRELYQAFAQESLKIGELAGGFAALMFATNVAMVQSARTARMYPLMTTAELAHIFFFVRTHHRPRVLNCILAAVFLAVAIAANFTAMFLLLGESIWLGYLMLAKLRRWPGIQLRTAIPALSLVAGLALLLPFVPAAVAASQTAIRGGALDWIGYQPPVAWFYHVLRDDISNKSLFRLCLAFVAFGIWRHWNRGRLVPIFLGAVLIGPFAAVALLSLVSKPMMVDRYVSLTLVAFLELAAIGAAAFRSKVGRMLVFVLIAWLSVRALRHSSGFWVDWKEAVAITCAVSSANATISVVPEYAVNVVRFYLPPERRSLASGLDSQCGSSQVLILSPGHLIATTYMSELYACYPRLLGRATRIEVRAR
jgi:mannosyltransferase